MCQAHPHRHPVALPELGRARAALFLSGIHWPLPLGVANCPPTPQAPSPLLDDVCERDEMWRAKGVPVQEVEMALDRPCSLWTVSMTHIGILK